MKRVIYNLECYSNFFSCSVEDFNSTEQLEFEISERKNNLKEIVQFFKKIDYVIGFNNNGYDDILINYLIKNYNRLSTSPIEVINKELKYINDCIILDQRNETRANYEIYSKYKWNFPPISIDIFLYWSKMTRIQLKISLNTIACHLHYPIIQEQPINIDKELEIEEFNIIKDHGTHNVKKTKLIARFLINEINLRLAANRKYGFDCYSWDQVKLGLNILIHRYCKRTGYLEEDVKNSRTFVNSVKLKDIIFDKIKFDYNENIEPIYYTHKEVQHKQFRSFYALLEYLKTLEVYGTKEIDVEVLYDKLRYDIKSGGLHSYHKSEIVEVKENYIYRDVDVSSYYPSLGSEWKIVPKHLGEEFGNELGDIKEERLELKRNGLGKSPEAELYKRALNGGYYGNLNNEFTPMYDWSKTLTVTINGQLFLLMLCEMLVKIGIRIDMCNTDGVTIYYHKDLNEKVNIVLKEWEDICKMELESVLYKKVVRANINNYLAIDINNKIKEKGYFVSKPLNDNFLELSRSNDFMVISKAIVEFFKNNTSFEQFILNHNNIYDFCAAYKVDKKFKVLWNGKIQQRLNRFYVSNKGAYLYKQKPESKEPENMLKGYPVQLFNIYEEKPIKEYDINYKYYIAECNKLINEFGFNQNKLF